MSCNSVHNILGLTTADTLSGSLVPRSLQTKRSVVLKVCGEDQEGRMKKFSTAAAFQPRYLDCCFASLCPPLGIRVGKISARFDSTRSNLKFAHFWLKMKVSQPQGKYATQATSGRRIHKFENTRIIWERAMTVQELATWPDTRDSNLCTVHASVGSLTWTQPPCEACGL